MVVRLGLGSSWRGMGGVWTGKGDGRGWTGKGGRVKVDK